MSSTVGETITALQRRYGPASIRQGEGPLSAEVWPVGIPTFDERLLPGGLPLGRISVLAGEERVGPSGRLTLLQAFTAMASRSLQVAYIDCAGTLDPGFLADLGADLAATVVLRPPAGRIDAGLAMGRAVIAAGVTWLAVALPGRMLQCPSDSAQRTAQLTALADVAHRTRAVVCFGAPAPLPTPLAYASSMTLRCTARGWHEAHGDVAGLRVGIETVKSKLGPPGATATVLLRYPRPFAVAEMVGVPSVIELPMEGYRSNSPPLAPEMKASHSADVNNSCGPCRSLESRTATATGAPFLVI